MHDDGLLAFERTHLEKLRLASEVILELAPGDVIPDTLEVELRLFRDRIEHTLLLPIALTALTALTAPAAPSVTRVPHVPPASQRPPTSRPPLPSGVASPATLAPPLAVALLPTAVPAIVLPITTLPIAVVLPATVLPATVLPETVPPATMAAVTGQAVHQEPDCLPCKGRALHHQRVVDHHRLTLRRKPGNRRDQRVCPVPPCPRPSM